MTWTELIAFWVTFVITFVGFVSWFSLNKRREKPSNMPNVIHDESQCKEMMRTEFEGRVDELRRNYVESHDPKIKAEIDELKLPARSSAQQ